MDVERTEYALAPSAEPYPLASLARAARFVLDEALRLVQGFCRDPRLEGGDFEDDQALLELLDIYQRAVTASATLFNHATAHTRINEPAADVSALECGTNAVNRASLALEAMRHAILSCDMLDDGDARMVRETCADTWAVEAEQALEHAIEHLNVLRAKKRLPLRSDLN